MIYGNRRDFIRAQNAIAEALKRGKTDTEALQAGLNAILGDLKPKRTNRQWLFSLSNKDFTQAVFSKIYSLENDWKKLNKSACNFEDILEPYQIEVLTQMAFENWLDAPWEDKKHGF